MTDPTEAEQADRRQLTAGLRKLLSDAVQQARDDSAKVTDPKAQVLFETTAEAVEGLLTALEHYEEGSQRVWR